MSDAQKNDWTIRRAGVGDARALTDCMHAAYATYASRLADGVLPPMTADYEREIRSCLVWVAESARRLVGGLILIPEQSYMTLANVAVHPQRQGAGLGRHLLALAEAEAGQRGYTELRLTTHVTMSENVSFYARLGWSETGRDARRVYMRKDLDDHSAGGGGGGPKTPV